MLLKGVKAAGKRALAGFGWEMRRIDLRLAPQPFPLDAYHAFRTIHYHDLLIRVRDVDGDIVECGVAGGQSLFTLALFSQLFPNKRTFWGFDSFEGLPLATDPDKLDPTQRQTFVGRFASGKERTLENIRVNGTARGTDVNLAKADIGLVEGWFPDSFKRYDRSRGIALLHLDVDLYQSYKDCLEFFYPLVRPGGIIAFDEYRNVVAGEESWVGATRAIDEFFSGKPEKPIPSILAPPKHYVVRT